MLKSKTKVVFPTLLLFNRKVMAYKKTLCYLYGNIREVWIFFFELNDQEIFVFLSGPPRGEGEGVKSYRQKSGELAQNILSTSPYSAIGSFIKRINLSG